MLFYITIPMIIMVIYLLTRISSRKIVSKFCFCFFSYLYLLFISAFRDISVGGDLQRYLPTYYGISVSDWTEVLLSHYDHFMLTSEFGFRIFQKLMSFIDASDQFYLFFTSFIIISLTFYCIYKYSSNVFLSIMIYVLLMYLSSFNIIRASICVALCLFAFKYIVDKKIVKFLIVVFVAFSVQKTSLFFLPAYFLWGRKIAHKYILLIIFICLGLSFVLTGNAIIDIVNAYFSIYELDADSKYLNNSGGITSMGIFLIVLVILLIYLHKKYIKDDVMFDFFILLIAVSAVFQIFSSNFQLLNRISLYYYSYLIYILPSMQKKVCKKNKVNIIIGLLFLVFSVIYYMDLLKDTNFIIPYKVWL